MISKAYYQYFIDVHACDDRFVSMAKAMGISEAEKAEDFITALETLKEKCGVKALKMSDYGMREEEIPQIVQNAFDTMGRLFLNDPTVLDKNDCIKILENSYQ